MLLIVQVYQIQVHNFRRTPLDDVPQTVQIDVPRFCHIGACQFQLLLDVGGSVTGSLNLLVPPSLIVSDKVGYRLGKVFVHFVAGISRDESSLLGLFICVVYPASPRIFTGGYFVKLLWKLYCLVQYMRKLMVHGLEVPEGKHFYVRIVRIESIDVV